MCGIVGYAGREQAAPVLLDSLANLEYRGYDSAGIAVEKDGKIAVLKAGGKLGNLIALADGGKALGGCCGIGHTRWATHGRPDEVNAHPHASPGRRVVVVHNGVIENHRELREMLKKQGYAFHTQTDTEAAVMLLDSCYAQGEGLTARERALYAIRCTMQRVRGSYALCILFGDQPGLIYAVRRGSPLIAGCCADGHVLASDVTAMLGMTRSAAYLKDGQIVCISAEEMCAYDEGGGEAVLQMQEITWDVSAAQKDGYTHYMRKEIDEQPRAVRDTLAAHIREENGQRHIDLRGTGMTLEKLAAFDTLYLIGCGSAYHAGMAGRGVIERLAQMPCMAELASELHGRELRKNALSVIISQSGETADSLSALRLCRQRGIKTLAIVNVQGSSIAREADAVLYTHAGPEIAVATTKAYSAQLAALYLLAIALACACGQLDAQREQALISDLLALPELIEEALGSEARMRQLAGKLRDCRSAFFIGRGLDYAAALEGSLKLKEISYIHSEAYAAGELKHGAISLIESGMPVIGVAMQTEAMSKTAVSMAEAASRGAYVIALVPEGQRAAAEAADDAVYLPRAEPLFAPSVAAVPLQLLAYHISCARGLDVDKPRNLAKSVTVE